MTTDPTLLERLTAFRKDHARMVSVAAGIVGILLLPAAILLTAIGVVLAGLA